MADVLLGPAMTWLAEHQTAYASPSVSIRRGIHTTTGVPAMLAMRDDPVTDNYGALTVPATDVGFAIDVAEYVIDGEEVEPRAGDVIITANGKEYEVAQPSTSEKAWTFPDGAEVKMLVHAKLVKG